MYFQDGIRKNNRNKTITTYIGRADLPPEKMLDAKSRALMSHYGKVHKYHAPLTYKTNYLKSEMEMLEKVKVLYTSVKTLVDTDEWEEAERNFYVSHVYGTTAIEGITLTEKETAKVLEEDLTPQNKPVQDVVAVANYRNVREMLKDYRGPINEKLILNIQSTLMYGMKNERGEPIPRGRYREKNVMLKGYSFNPPDWSTVKQQMRYAILEYEQGMKENNNPIELAAIFHQKFEEIHPFQDGNGRTGREILNLMLRKAGFPPIYIKPEDRSLYITSLEEGNMGDHKPLVRFVLFRIIATMMYMLSRTGIYKLLASPILLQYAKEQKITEFEEAIKGIKEFRDAEGPP
ncbi:Fic family protein [Nitrososphaera sp.]|uniref:Fic family protein n=1 Tax=Nitrososphaera sp. TaxID=1971748 RepID=UPI00319DBB8C